MSLDWYCANADPSEAELREFSERHICRCTGYVPIIAAALDAAQRRAKENGGDMKWCRYSSRRRNSFGLIQDER
jgi:2-furoyl-CoA dehydrogenase 2Fe-2S iron sulfur subunit